METYEEKIEQNYIVVEIKFNIELPSYCDDQEFKLYQVIDEEEVQVMDFSLLFNDREAIEHTDNGTISYTGDILLTDVETVVISQLEIEEANLPQYKQREFILKVL